MKTYRKSDVETHSASNYGRQLPAVNVKRRRWTSEQVVMERFGCSAEQAERALQFASESACEQFWEDAPEVARDIFGAHVKVWSAGRSSGWLVVEGLPDIESWDAVALGKWRKFERIIRADVEYRCSDEPLLDDIEANEWHKEGSERFNFIDSAEGVQCIADLKASAKAAGFGSVVRA